MVNSLHSKLILFAVFSILLALSIAGVSIDYLLAALYGEKAEHEAEHAYELVYEKIKTIEKNMADQGFIISSDPAVVATVNLVNRYQDINNYQPLVFDEEKKNLASNLLERLNVYHRAKAAIYNKKGQLIAFSIHHDLDNIIGITTYNKSAVKYVSKDSESNVWQSKSLPPSIASQIDVQSDWDSFVSRSGKVEYFSNENDFTIEGFRTIQRDHLDGTSESIGFVKIIVEFNGHYISELSNMSHVMVSLVLANEKILNKPDELVPLYNLDAASILFGSKQVSKKTWFEHHIYYIHSYVLPVVNGRVFLLISQPRSELDLALNRSRYSLFLIFLFTASLVISFGIYWLNTRVSDPLKKLTEQLDKVDEDEYEYPEYYASNSKDEISLLGNGLNKMVSVIKSREEELKTSRYDLNEAQHLAKIGSWKLDIVNDEFDWSDEVYNIFELAPKEHGSSYEKLLEIVFPEDRERVNAAYLNSLNNRQPYDITYRLQMKNGSIKYIHQHCESVFDDEGNPLTSKGTVQDITEKKFKDEIVSRTQKMDALGKLTGGIAHDFNNMLGVILGYSELLQNTLASDTKELKYINEILAAGDRARMLTKKLLAFSRKEASTPEVLDVNKLLLEDRNLLEKTLTARIGLVYDFAEDLWPVFVDKSDIQNAVLNMSINAMHAISGTGKLTIQTSNVHLNVTDVQSMDIDAGDYMLLSLSDTGCGMDEETRSNLFDPFFSTKGEKGTGLGMTQVYAFVNQAGGSIYVYSELGYGTRIAIYLPRSSEYEFGSLEMKHDMDEQVETGHETILVVDDETALRELAEEILNNHDYRVLCAKSGVEALKVLETESVDLLLSDVIMPDMDGYQLAEKVTERYPDVKIQMASGFSDERNLNATNEKLHEERLQKPFTSKILLRRIRQLLDENKKSVDESTASIQWSNKFRTGIGVIDSDHKVLVSLISRSQKAINDDQHDEMLSILEELIAYVGYHFTREELVMEICEYPDVNNHKRQHEKITMQVTDYVKEYGEGKLTEKTLVDFLVNWLTAHILKEDFAIIPYCKDKDIKIEQAFKNAGYDYQSNDSDD